MSIDTATIEQPIGHVYGMLSSLKHEAGVPKLTLLAHRLPSY